MGDGDPNIDAEIMDPKPVMKTKAKARAKGKKKGSTSKLRDEIRANRKEVPNLEIGLRVRR